MATCDQAQKEIKSPFFRRGEKAEERSELYKGFARSIERFSPNFGFCNCLQADLCLIQTARSFILSPAFLPFSAHFLRIANCTLRITAEEKQRHQCNLLWGTIVLPSRPSPLLRLSAQCWFPRPRPQCPPALLTGPSP